MSEKKKLNKNLNNLRNLPPIDEILRSATAREITEKFGADFLTATARRVVGEMRGELLARKSEGEISRENLLREAENRLQTELQKEIRHGVKKVINATGVIIHTNLGRAPLAEKAICSVAENAARYCALEYDLETGKRGKRGARVEELICELTGAEEALVVNNCAAATFFVLSALASGGEAVVSRGELVEIGGDFRIPDVMRQSGTELVEIGTTNRTKLRDFAAAVTEKTRVFLRVHPSNFRIVGFTEMPALAELAVLAKEKGVILYEDAGSGAMVDLSKFGLGGEPVIPASIKAGVDIITFSGDKLLGASQSGIIAGKKNLIETLRKHPLYRALRLDKISYSILEATLEIYRKGTHFEEIPVLQMISATPAQIKKRAENFIKKFKQTKTTSDLGLRALDTIKGESAIGGGSAPLARLETTPISIVHEKFSASEIAEKLRRTNPPVITRILEDKVLIDLRTVSEFEEKILLDVLASL